MIKHREEANDTGEGELVAAKRLLNKAFQGTKGSSIWLLMTHSHAILFF